MDTPPIAELFYELTAFLADKTKRTPLEHRVYVDTIDDDWSFKFNATMQEQEQDGTAIPPLTFIIAHRDFPAGIIDPFGGMLIGGSEHGAAERELLAAVAAAKAVLA